MSLNLEAVTHQAVAAGAAAAGTAWASIRTVATQELHTLCARLAQIAAGVASGDITRETALILVGMARNNAIATIAMLTTHTVMLAQRVVDAALAVILHAVNAAAGFPLIRT